MTPYNSTKHRPQREDVSDTKLIKIDTTSDLRQKAKKWKEAYFYLRMFQGPFDHCGHLNFSMVLWTDPCVIFTCDCLSNKTISCFVCSFSVQSSLYQFFIHCSLLILYIVSFVSPSVFLCTGFHFLLCFSFFMFFSFTFLCLCLRAQQHLRWCKWGAQDTRRCWVRSSILSTQISLASF